MALKYHWLAHIVYGPGTIAVSSNSVRKRTKGPRSPSSQLTLYTLRCPGALVTSSRCKGRKAQGPQSPIGQLTLYILRGSGALLVNSKCIHRRAQCARSPRVLILYTLRALEPQWSTHTIYTEWSRGLGALQRSAHAVKAEGAQGPQNPIGQLTMNILRGSCIHLESLEPQRSAYVVKTEGPQVLRALLVSLHYIFLGA